MDFSWENHGSGVVPQVFPGGGGVSVNLERRWQITQRTIPDFFVRDWTSVISLFQQDISVDRTSKV